VLFLILFWGSWLALQPGYSLSPWRPHNLMRWLGFPYSGLLWLDHNIATLIHFMVATIGVVLLYYCNFSQAKLALPGAKKSRTLFKPLSPFICAAIFCMLALFTELAQLLIGRGFEFTDLFIGWLGVAIGYNLIGKQVASDGLE
jgi:hypothetical protein